MGEERPSMSLEDWQHMWENGQTGWHLDHVNTFLLDETDCCGKFLRNLVENIEILTDGKQACRILVPLCGKTMDLLWLVKQGHTVIGIELIQKAIEDFFQENNVSFVKKDIDGYGHCYTAFDGKLKIFDCDYFKFNSSLAGGKVDAIWDCNALGAMSPGHWQTYLQTSLELFDHPHCRILLQALLYDQEEYAGPPFSVQKEELSRLLGDPYEVNLVNRKPAEDLRAFFGQSWLYTAIISIKNK